MRLQPSGRCRVVSSPASDIWYLVDPLTALDLPGRIIVRHADFIDLALLRRDLFLTTRLVRVHVVLPPRFEDNGKGKAIRASFPQATAWSRTGDPGRRIRLLDRDVGAWWMAQ